MTESVRFLQMLRPRGPWNLVSINPDTGETRGVTFTDPVKMERWISKGNGKLNLYYQPAPTAKPTGRMGRLRKTDIHETDVVAVDIDLDKLTADHPWGGLGLADRKARMVEVLMAFTDPGPPTFIVDTGGGVQCLWRLDVLQPVTAEYVTERMAEHLIDVLGGDHNAKSIAQPMRLPGTTNLPDASKRARGRVQVPAVLLEASDRAYADLEFQLAPVRPKTEVDIEIGDPEQVDDMDTFAEQYEVPERIVRVITEGPLTDEPKQGDDSPSAWVFEVACALVRLRVPSELIAGILLDDRYGIAREGVLTHDDDERQAFRAIKHAHEVIGESDFPDDVDEDLGDVVPSDGAGRHDVAGLSFLRADEVEPKPLNPLWPGRMFIGKLTTLAGMPDQGKSVVTCDIAARVSRGSEWPDGSGRAPQGSVIILSAEDDPEDTIVPRLMAAGAAMDRVFILNSLVTSKKGRRMFSISDDVARLTAFVNTHPDVRALIVDPANAYMGTSKEHDSFRDSDVRAVLGPLKEWAEEHEIAVLIITHFKKGGTGRAIDQVMGSLAFTALSRSAWAFIEERDEDGETTGRKVMAKIKQNITEAVDALAYSLVGVQIAEGIGAPRVQWGEVVQGTADDVMGGSKARPAEKLATAIAFLRRVLADGPRPTRQITLLSREADVAEKTLNRAKDELGVVSERVAGKWVWRMKDARDEFDKEVVNAQA